MITYKLIEKRDDQVRAIIYEVKIMENDDKGLIYLVRPNEGKILISGNITETKRGWTIISWWLTTKPIKIFLPRENFEKVEME